MWRGSRSLANPLVQGPRAVTSASGTERREHKVARPPEDARAQLPDLPTRGHLRLARPACCGPVSLSLSNKEMEQRAPCGPAQPQESYDFMSPWLLSLDKLSSPQDREP